MQNPNDSINTSLLSTFSIAIAYHTLYSLQIIYMIGRLISEEKCHCHKYYDSTVGLTVSQSISITNSLQDHKKIKCLMIN